MSIIFNSADIAETMNNGVANVTGADSTITENYTNVVQHGIKIDMSVSEKTISGVPPLTFNSNGTALIDYTIYGNTVQEGTPTPDSPIAVNGVGTLSSGNYVIPVSTNTVTNINLNSVTTTRKIKKLVLTGDETDLRIQQTITSTNAIQFPTTTSDYKREPFICSHMEVTNSSFGSSTHGFYGQFLTLCFELSLGLDTIEKVRIYLRQQYANNTPVTIWYVLAEPTTSTLNEPLMKIGDYADSVSFAQSSVTIPTASGNNTLDVGTTPKPSNVSITYKGR